MKYQIHILTTLYISLDIPIQALPSPVYPEGQSGHVPPTAGGLLSIHSASLIHDI